MKIDTIFLIAASPAISRALQGPFLKDRDKFHNQTRLRFDPCFHISKNDEDPEIFISMEIGHASEFKNTEAIRDLLEKFLSPSNTLSVTTLSEDDAIDKGVDPSHTSQKCQRIIRHDFMIPAMPVPRELDGANDGKNLYFLIDATQTDIAISLT